MSQIKAQQSSEPRLKLNVGFVSLGNQRQHPKLAVDHEGGFHRNRRKLEKSPPPVKRTAIRNSVQDKWVTRPWAHARNM